MTNDIQTLRDDIAYLKALAQGGQDGSRQGGAILMAAGLFYGAASLLQWAAMAHVLNLTTSTTSWAWLLATGLFCFVLAVVKVRWGRQGARAKGSDLAWQGVGIGCFFIFAAIAAATWRTQSPLLIQFVPSIIFVLYGAAWTAVAAASGKLWLHLTAWGSFVAAVGVAWFIGDPISYVIYALGLMLLAFLPGLIFTLPARAAKVA